MTWVGRAMPIFVLPWFTKILIDHVVLGEPIEEAEQYPVYMTPVLDKLQGYSALEIMVFLAIVGVGLVLAMGAYPGYRDEVEAGLIEGRDYATSTENAMHGGHSSMGGFYGYVEFTMNMRLTQALNHTVRSHVFSRITGLSMTRLEDQRIGDSIYRVLYDTPQINEIFYQIVHTPVMTITLFIAAAWTMLSAYPTVPELLWMTVVILPLWFGVSSLFAPIVRRRGQAARAAGALTTSTIEEGMDNMLRGAEPRRQQKGTGPVRRRQPGVVQAPPGAVVRVDEHLLGQRRLQQGHRAVLLLLRPADGLRRQALRWRLRRPARG